MRYKKKCDRVWLMGGLGNNLFQLVYAKSLMEQGKNVKIVVNLLYKSPVSVLKNWTLRTPSPLIGLYGMDVLRLSRSEVYIFLIRLILDRIINHVFSFNIDLNKGDHVGYYQDKRELSIRRKHILNIADKLRTKEDRNSPEVVVHYRGNDSDWASDYSYYNKVRKSLISNKYQFVVVTDDYQSALDFYDKTPGLIKIYSSSVERDMQIMLNASILYIAPSTLSWWCAHALDSDKLCFLPEDIYSLLGFYNTCSMKVL